MKLREFYNNLKIFYNSSAEVFEKLFDTYTFELYAERSI